MDQTTCIEADCRAVATRRYLCAKHYQRRKRRGDLPPSQRAKREASCDFDGCEAPARTRGMCKKHYTRWHRHGSPAQDRRATRALSDLDRFFSNFKVGPMRDCWIWMGTVVSSRPGDRGYGQFSAGAKKGPAHRFAYEAWIGPIPAGMQIDHVYSRGCRDTRCVNPFHLEPVTSQENMRRMAAARRAERAIRVAA